MSTVRAEQRFSRAFPCPVCGGCKDDPRGNGRRCYGFLFEDGRSAVCTREERAAQLRRLERLGGGYVHALDRPCECGADHETRPGAPNRPGVDVIPAPKCSRGERGIVTRYEIRNEDNVLIAIHCRKDFGNGNKNVWWERPDGTQDLAGIPVVDLPLYGVHELPSTIDDEPVFVTEGEKARDALKARGFVAVATVTGAGGTPRDTSLRPLLGRRVVLWPDNDPDGDDHMRRNGAAVVRLGYQEMRVLEWPNAPPKGDAFDFFELGGTKESLRQLLVVAKPFVTPDGGKETSAHGHLQPGSRAGAGVEPLDDSDVAAAPDSIPSPKGAVGNESNFRPITAAELLALLAEPIEWLWESFLPVGSLATLTAFMKVGKTTFVYALLVAIAKGLPFLGRRTKKTGVLILALEEHPRDVRRRLERFGMTAEDPIYVQQVPVRLDLKTVTAIKRFVRDEEIGLVVVDTLARLWQIRDENDNVQVLNQLSPLLELARDTGAVVLLVHHDRKSGGDDGRAIRGGSALLGLVDQALMLDRRQGGSSNHRTLKTVGRYDETPRELIIALEGNEYTVLAGPDDLDRDLRQAKLLKTLSDTPKTVEQLATETGLSEKIVKGVLVDLGEEVVRDGQGVKGSPYTYRRLADSIPSQAHPLEPESNPTPPKAEASAASSPTRKSPARAHRKTTAATVSTEQPIEAAGQVA